MPQLLLVNRFTILKIESVNISNNKSKDAYPFTPANYSVPQRPKWKRQLPKELSANALDVCRISLVLTMKLSTTNTSKLCSINVLLDCKTTRSFINCNFVCSKRINTQTISRSIPVFNIDGSLNKASQILEVVDVVFCYWTYSERILLVVSSLGKQKLILDYTWLKDYNPKVDWEKGKVHMIQYLP